MFKKLIPAYILSFVISFTLFIYEPIVLYASNNTDLWFDFKTMLNPVFKLFLISLLFFVIIYTFIKLISRKDKIYNVSLIISFVIYFASYIQGNYLLSKLPGLDGATIVWKGFFFQNLITTIIWLVLIFTYIITVKRFKFENVIKVSSKIVLVVFIMLLVSSISTMMTTKKMFMSKQDVTSTTKYYADFSYDKNFVILLIDAVDSQKFSKVLKKNKYSNILNDFTYYPDMLSYYPYTRESVPLALTGIPNYNETDFYTYYNNAFDKSPLFDKLSESGYDINIYDHEFKWVTKKSSIVKNSVSTTKNIKLIPFAVSELKYVGYKYLPFAFKKYAKIENMDFSQSKYVNDDTPFNWCNIHNYDLINASTISVEKTKQFKFIHLSGAHYPFVEDEELHWVDEKDSSYEIEIKATIKLLDRYLNWLKESNVYDNSVIIIMADHGYTWSDDVTRFNPVLYIKGIDETSKKMRISDKKVSQIDLVEAYEKLLDGKNSSELFKNFPSDRVRKCIWYNYTKEDHMVEYVQTGNAWDKNTLTKTGKEYDR